MSFSEKMAIVTFVCLLIVLFVSLRRKR